MLSAVAGSGVLDVTVAVPTSVPGASGRTMTVTVTEAWFARVPRLKVKGAADRRDATGGRDERRTGGRRHDQLHARGGVGAGVGHGQAKGLVAARRGRVGGGGLEDRQVGGRLRPSRQ